MSSFVLKILACIFMLIDHIGFAFFPKLDILRAIGRLAFPIFAFQISIGFDKTKNKEKYILRMIILTLISQIPFFIFRKMCIANPSPLLNVGATFTLALLILYCFEEIKQPWVKYLSIISIFLLSVFIPIDYKWYGVLAVVLFYIFRKEKYGIAIFYPILVILQCMLYKSTFNLPEIYALIPILLYNGKKGKNIKYLFYVFYPLHFIILALIKLYVL